MTESLSYDDHPLAALRARLLDAALPHVVFDGWSKLSLQRAAEQIGETPAAAAAAFPGGGIEALELFFRRADHETASAIAALPLAGMKIRQKISEGVMARFIWAQPHREAVRRGLALLANPLQAPLAAKLVWRTADTIWHAIGDTSTDMNYYSKRTLLSGVYAATSLVWLDDATEDLHITRAFLARRIEDVMQIEKAKTFLRSLPFPNFMPKRA